MKLKLLRRWFADDDMICQSLRHGDMRVGCIGKLLLQDRGARRLRLRREDDRRNSGLPASAAPIFHSVVCD